MESILRLSRPSNCSLLWVCFRFRKDVELKSGSNPFSGPLSLFSGSVFISGHNKSLFSGLVYIFGESKSLLSDYMHLFWCMEGACGETKPELK